MLQPVDSHNPTGYSYAGPEILGDGYAFSALESNIRNLDSTEALFICAKINLVISEASFRGFDCPKVQAFVTSDLWSLEWISPFDTVALEAALKPPHLKILFGRQGLFELMRWLALWDGPVVDPSRQRMSYIRALLNANDLASEYQGSISRDEIGPAAGDLKMFLALRLFRELTLWQSPTFDPRWQFGRARALFIEGFLKDNPDYRNQLEERLKMSLEDYLACVIAILSISQNWFVPGRIPRLRSNLEIDLATVSQDLKPEMKSIVSQFFELTSRNVSELTELIKKKFSDPAVSFELRPFREKPLLTDGENRLVIVDQTLLAECGSAGLLFRLLPKNGESVFVSFGKSFENYVSGVLAGYVSTMQTSKSGFSGWGPALNANNKHEELSDFIMIDGETVALIETKTGVIKDSLVRQTAEQYWAELMTRYGMSESHEGKKSKGVYQLARSIKRWVEGTARLEEPLESKVTPKTIIPVLLVYDPYLPILGHGYFLAKEFNLALTGQSTTNPSFSLNGVEVKTLCLMSIDQFETFEGSITKKTLPQLLLEYCEQYPYRDITAGAYLSQLQPESEMFESKLVRESLQALDAARIRLFGV